MPSAVNLSRSRVWWMSIHRCRCRQHCRACRTRRQQTAPHLSHRPHQGSARDTRNLRAPLCDRTDTDRSDFGATDELHAPYINPARIGTVAEHGPQGTCLCVPVRILQQNIRALTALPSCASTRQRTAEIVPDGTVSRVSIFWGFRLLLVVFFPGCAHLKVHQNGVSW